MIRVVCGCGRVFKAEERHSGKRTRCPVCGSEPDHRADAGLELERGGPGRGPVVVVSQRSAGPFGVGRATRRAGPATPIRCERRSCRGPDAGVDGENGSDRRAGAGEALREARAADPRAGGVWVLAWGRGGVGGAGPGGGCAGCARPPPARRADPAGRRPAGRARPAPASRQAGDGRDRGAASTVPGRGRPPRPDGCDCSCPPTSTRRAKAASNGDRLMDAAAKVDLIVIVNPDTGPGIERNPDYAAAIAEAADRGVKLRRLCQHRVRRTPAVRGQGRHRRLGPVLSPDRRLLPRPAAPGCRACGLFRRDRVPMPAASSATPWSSPIRASPATSPTWPDTPRTWSACSPITRASARSSCRPTSGSYDPSHYAALVYQVADAESMSSMLKEAIIKRIGYIYVTDGKPPNPWGRLPAYWEAEVEAVMRLQ